MSDRWGDRMDEPGDCKGCNPIVALIKEQFDVDTLEQVCSINAELSALDEEIRSIHLEHLPWGLIDYTTVFAAGIMGGLLDMTIGRPGGYDEPSIGLLKRFDRKNNPIDTDHKLDGSYNKSVGDHRLYSPWHDLLRFLSSVRKIMTAEQGNWEPVSDPFEAAVIVLVHLYKDFWTARSLPIPGTSIVSDVIGGKMPKVLEDLYRNEVNLRQLTGQALSMIVIQYSVSICCVLEYHETDTPAELVRYKRDIMHLVSHCVALSFNMGKVLVSGNPFLANVPQILRVVRLAFSILREAVETGHRATLKSALSNHAVQYDILKTAILVSKVAAVSLRADEAFATQNRSVRGIIHERQMSAREGFQLLNTLIERMADLSSEGEGMTESSSCRGFSPSQDGIDVCSCIVVFFLPNLPCTAFGCRVSGLTVGIVRAASPSVKGSAAPASRP